MSNASEEGQSLLERSSVEATGDLNHTQLSMAGVQNWLPTLSGEENESAINSFFIRLEKLGRRANYDEEMMAMLFSSRLRGKAASVVNDWILTEGDLSYEQIKGRYLKFFNKAPNNDQAMLELYSMKQKRGESNGIYNLRFKVAFSRLGKGKECSPDLESMIVFVYIRSLSKDKHREAVARCQPKTLHEAYEVAEKEDLFDEACGASSTAVNALDMDKGGSEEKRAIERLTDLVCNLQIHLQNVEDRLKEPAVPAQRRTNPPRCYICNAVGHIARDCKFRGQRTDLNEKFRQEDLN